MTAIDSTPRASGRWPAVDLVRGLVMVIMALDHTRDFVHAGAMAFPPDNLAQTTPALFFTRWITHICAPTFMFTAGLGAWFRLERDGASVADLSRYLWTRGLWLVLLEVTVVRFAFFFNFTYDVTFLLVFWSIGVSMIVLSVLVRLPYRAILIFGLGLILLHNLADGIRAEQFGGYAWVWILLHQQGLLIAKPVVVIAAYPLVPWIGVMAVGFCFGRVYRLPDERRRTLLIRLGLALTAAFIVVRALNVYGDPRPWAPHERGAVFTVLSFLNTAKYPPSLAFLLMTLGPAIALLGLFDGARPERHPVIVFGRTPMFYFVMHLAVIHLFQIGLTWLRYGAAPFLFTPPPTVGSPRDLFPPDYGWSLWVAYVVTALVVLTMYPMCLWLSRLKARRRDWWVSYL